MRQLLGLAQHETAEVRRAAVRALGKMRSDWCYKERIEAIRRLLKDGNSEVREAATIAVRDSGRHALRTDFREDVETLLQSEDSGARRSAAKAASRIRSTALTPTILANLMRQLVDESTAAKHAAARTVMGLMSQGLRIFEQPEDERGHRWLARTLDEWSQMRSGLLEGPAEPGPTGSWLAAAEGNGGTRKRSDHGKHKDVEPKQKPKLEIDQWKQLGIGIDEDWTYWAVTPCPKPGDVFPKESAVKLELPGRRWEELLDLLATSENGNTARKVEVLRKFGYLRGGKISREHVEDAKMKELKTQPKLLRTAMADLGRGVTWPDLGQESRQDPASECCIAGLVQAGFVVRYLVRDKDGKLRFGGIA